MGYEREERSISNDEEHDARSDVERALQPVNLPAPKPKRGQPATPVRTDRAPSIQEILDPERPSLEGAEQGEVVESIKDMVEDFYEKLDTRLTEMKAALAERPAPPRSDPAVRLIAWIAEMIATSTLGVVGSVAAKAVGAKLAANLGSKLEKPAEDAVRDMSKTASKTAGTMVGHAVHDALSPRPPADRASEDGRGPSYYSLTHEMLDEFIEATRAQTLGRKHDALTTVRLLRSSASQQVRTGLVSLDEQLRAALRGPELATWFNTKVTMEWMNFCARMSLGGPKDPEKPELTVANQLGGVLASGDPQARADWRRPHDGFVEIGISVPDEVRGTEGLSLTVAKAVTGPRAVEIVHTASALMGPDGKPLTLATLPVFRRITLRTGPTALEVHVAFVITPDGTIEADLGNEVLAAIGRGEPVQLGGTRLLHGTERRPDSISNAIELGQLGALAMVGAQRIAAWLATQDLSVVR